MTNTGKISLLAVPAAYVATVVLFCATAQPFELMCAGGMPFRLRDLLLGAINQLSLAIGQFMTWSAVFLLPVLVLAYVWWKFPRKSVYAALLGFVLLSTVFPWQEARLSFVKSWEEYPEYHVNVPSYFRFLAIEPGLPVLFASPGHP